MECSPWRHSNNFAIMDNSNIGHLFVLVKKRCTCCFQLLVSVSGILSNPPLQPNDCSVNFLSFLPLKEGSSHRPWNLTSLIQYPFLPIPSVLYTMLSPPPPSILSHSYLIPFTLGKQFCWLVCMKINHLDPIKIGASHSENWTDNIWSWHMFLSPISLFEM